MFSRLAILLVLPAGIAQAAESDAGKLEFFEKKVRPILVSHCYSCHSADTKPAGGLRVDDRRGLLTGGNTGASIVPGKANESLLIKRVSSDAKKRMPSEGTPLTDAQIADLKQWIDDGATWPALKVPASLTKEKPEFEALKKEHWAFKPLKNAPAPAVKDASWARDEIDRFLLAKLEAKNLKPVADADKKTLIRRLTFDLTGLPPTPSEIDQFLADTSATATEKLVDRLLASPKFGEQWGRHWLDVARYGESTGPSRNIPYPHAWKYRDYVIDSFNQDVPFNQFVNEQIAGDLLPATNSAEKDRQKIATGFLALGVKDVNQRFKVRFIMDNVDEQIDAVTRSVLGLTVSCARCHDHKFDPVTQAEYYALAGIFTSTENAAGVRNLMGGGGLAYYVPEQLIKLSGTLPPPPPEQVAKLTAEVAEAKKAWDSIRGTPEGLKPGPNGQPTQRPIRLKFERLQSELLSLTDPAQRGQAAHGVRDAKEISDTEIRLRGEAEKLGPIVPRGYISAVHVPNAKPINREQSGRLELAQWLTSEQNPLTARVFANRVWAHLFGRGLVSTVDNFGVNGDVPTNPELLDHLAQRLIANGWSTKQLIRTLVLTRAYQLSADSTPEHRQQDPANTLVWRHSPRRLTAEEIRDDVLAISGTLNESRIVGSPIQHFKMIEMRDNGPEANTVHEAADKSQHRSVYLPLLRGVTPKTLEPFDPVEQTLVTGVREQTTVPSQALFMLNSTFIRQQALNTAQRLLKDTTVNDEGRINLLYKKAFGRTATATEISRATEFLTSYAKAIAPEFTKPKPEPKKTVNAKPVLKKKADEPPLDPDQIDQTAETVAEATVQAPDATTAAWLALVQSVYGSAEFRFIK